LSRFSVWNLGKICRTMKFSMKRCK
jgi:hypothetical protein